MRIRCISLSLSHSITDERIAREWQAYGENIRKILKSATIDLKSKEHMLHETLDNWKVYHSSYGQLKSWLGEGEQILRRRSDDEKRVSQTRCSSLVFACSQEERERERASLERNYVNKSSLTACRNRMGYSVNCRTRETRHRSEFEGSFLAFAASYHLRTLTRRSASVGSFRSRRSSRRSMTGLRSMRTWVQRCKR